MTKLQNQRLKTSLGGKTLFKQKTALDKVQKMCYNLNCYQNNQIIYFYMELIQIAQHTLETTPEQIRQALLHLPTTFTQALIAGGGLKILLVSGYIYKFSDGQLIEHGDSEVVSKHKTEPTPDSGSGDSAKTNPSGFNRTTENDSPDPRSYPNGNTTGYQRSSFDNPNVVSQPTGGGGFWGFLNGRGKNQQAINQNRRDAQRHENNWDRDVADNRENLQTGPENLGVGGVQPMDESSKYIKTNNSTSDGAVWLDNNGNEVVLDADRNVIKKL